MYNLFIRDRFDTLQLQSDGIAVLDYAIRGPRPQSGRSASDISALPPKYDDISETLRLMVMGALQTHIQDTIRRLEAFLERARLNSRRRPQDAVYLYIQFDDDIWQWRSELLRGELTVDNPLGDLWKLKTPIAITFTRRYYWEMAETQPVALPISAHNQSPALGGRTVTFARNNWIQIAAPQVGGSLPAPLKLDVENTRGSSQFMEQMWIINNAHADPTAAQVTLTAAQMTGSGSNRWEIPASLLNASKGRYVRALLHHTSGGVTGTAQGFFEVAVGSSYYVAWQGQQVERRGITDLGVFPLPPGAESDGYGNVYFRVATEWPVDHLKLIPVSSERRLMVVDDALSSGLGFADGTAIVDDGILGESYAETEAGVKMPLVVGYGEPLWVWPGQTQRIYIEWAGFTSGYEPTYVGHVRAWIRPRRGTV